MGYRLFPCSCVLLYDATALSAVYFQPQLFFSLKCGFRKPDKTIIMENNVVTQQGCKLVKPERKLFSNKYCWDVGNNPE